jgi:hypothetical protein
MSKKAQFLNKNNKNKVIKLLYIKHINDGGTSSLKTFDDLVPTLMENWKSLNTIDTYESLTLDSAEELNFINELFISDHESTFTVDSEYKNIKKLTTPQDYHSLDTQPPKNLYVSNSTYRYNNTIPLYQLVPDRHYDRDSIGVHGRSIDNDIREHGDLMSSIMAEIDKPYRQISDDDVDKIPDDSQLSLVSTMWKSK